MENEARQDYLLPMYLWSSRWYNGENADSSDNIFPVSLVYINMECKMR